MKIGGVLFRTAYMSRHQSRIKGEGGPGQFLLEGPYDVIHDVNVCKS